MARYLNIAFLWFFSSGSLYSQSEQYHIEHLSQQDGLSHGCISCILQDSKGFMWFGTEGGLNRYDGYTITEYRLPNNFIRTLFEDTADNGKVLWIGTKGGGLVKFDKETEQFIQYQHDPSDPTSLSHNEVKCIYKDKAGVYWIGTEGGGLNKFDRKTGKFVSYQPDPNNSYSLSGREVNAICEDHLGNLWIGATGVNRFDRKTEHFVHYDYKSNAPNGLPSERVAAILEDHEKVLWIGTTSGLCLYDRNADQFVRYRFSSGRFNDLIFWAIHEDNWGELWFALQVGGMVNMNQQRERYVRFQQNANNSNSLNSNSISSVFRDKSGIVWAGTYCEGINKLIPVRKKFEHFKNVPGDSASLSNNWVLSIFEDNAGVVWIGPTSGGLNKFDRSRRTFTQYRFHNDWFENIFNICQSKSGTLWLARGDCLTEFNPKTREFTNYNGKYLTYSAEVFSCIDSLIKLNKAIASIQQVGNNQSLAGEFEMSQPANVLIVAAGEGGLDELFDYGWVDLEGTRDPFWKMEAKQARYAGGAFKNRLQVAITMLKPGKYRLHYQSNSKHSYKAWTGMPPDNPELWGIFVLPITRNEIKAVKPLLATENYKNLGPADLAAIYEDRSGKLWCVSAMRGALHYFDPAAKQFIPYEIADAGDISSDVTIVFEDRSGDFWVGTYNNGLLRQIRNEAGAEYVQYQSKDDDPGSISNNHITAIHEDRTGFLWIGTDDGLNKFDKNSGIFIRYTQKDGIAFGRIMGILEDNKGNLWFSTNKSLVKLNPTSGALRNFDENDGLPNNLYSAYGKSKDGQMFFGGNNGLTAFYPDSIQENLHKPQIALTDFQILNQSVVPGKDSPLKKAISEADEITLSYKQNMFSFKFAALDFTCPEKNQYAYKMKGFHDDWIHCGHERTALFMNLDPGKYVFKVKASNNDGVWNEEGTSVKIIITPPWWKTWWAYALYVTLLALTLYVLHLYDLKRQRLKHQLELEHVHAEKLEELDRMKSHFFANISHEFRTPLTLILGPLEKLIAEARAGELKQQFQIMQRSGKNLLNLINQLLDISRLESGSMLLRARCQDIVSLSRRLVETFISAAERKHITLEFKPADETILAYVEQDKLEKIVNNLLSNAFKFTPAGGKISVRLASHHENLPSELVRKFKQGYVEIVVADTGIGILPGNIDKIFDRFYQADASQARSYGGTGIGLALAKELVELHHGDISVASERGMGTTFIVRLPLGKAHLAPEEIVEKPSVKSTEEEPLAEREEIAAPEIDVEPRRARRVRSAPILLVVEDNQDMRAYLCNLLSPAYRVIESVDGQDGLKKALRFIPDLIISDVMMFQMDGFALCGRLKTDERTSHIPVILLTARASADSRITGLEIGADDYIAKPFEARELLARVKNLIAQRRKLRERFRKETALQPHVVAVTSTDEKFLQKALALVEARMSDEDFSVEMFGREVGMSRVQLHRKLRALTDHSASEFIRTLRLNRAAQLLSQHGGNVTEVAYQVGFNNLSYFAKCFHQQFGVNPHTYAADAHSPGSQE